MQNYENLINDLLKGETPKQRYDFLVWLLSELEVRENCMKHDKEYLENMSRSGQINGDLLESVEYQISRIKNALHE